jgi:hypothetical protein
MNSVLPEMATSAPQVTLEVVMRKNKEEAEQLFEQAKRLLAENRRISTELARIVVKPPSSTAVPASEGTSRTIPNSGRYSMVNLESSPPTVIPSSRPDPVGGLLHAADALVRSWKRRNKKNFKQLELDLMMALEKVNGGP